MLRSSDLVLNPSATILVLKIAIKILETFAVTTRTPRCLFGWLLGLQKLLLFLHFHPTSGPHHMPWIFFCVLWGWVSAVFFCGVQLSDWVTYIFFLTNSGFRAGCIQWQDSRQKFTDLDFFILNEGLIRWNLKKKTLSLVQELTTGHTKFSHTHTQTHFTNTAFLITNCVANGWMQDALHTGTFTHRLFHTQRLLHKDSLTERDMYAQKMWPHTRTADTTHTKTQKGLQKQCVLQTKTF